VIQNDTWWVNIYLLNLYWNLRSWTYFVLIRFYIWSTNKMNMLNAFWKISLCFNGSLMTWWGEPLGHSTKKHLMSWEGDCKSRLQSWATNCIKNLQHRGIQLWFLPLTSKQLISPCPWDATMIKFWSLSLKHNI